jgi:hypothetical protein
MSACAMRSPESDWKLCPAVGARARASRHGSSSGDAASLGARWFHAPPPRWPARGTARWLGESLLCGGVAERAGERAGEGARPARSLTDRPSRVARKAVGRRSPPGDSACSFSCGAGGEASQRPNPFAQRAVPGKRAFCRIESCSKYGWGPWQRPRGCCQ